MARRVQRKLAHDPVRPVRARQDLDPARRHRAAAAAARATARSTCASITRPTRRRRPSRSSRRSSARRTAAGAVDAEPAPRSPASRCGSSCTIATTCCATPRASTLIPLLIFDQFEEIFTLAQTDDFGRQRASGVPRGPRRPGREPRRRRRSRRGWTATSPPPSSFDFTRGDYRILIALREDYLAHLEGVKGEMPSITQNRMRLARMTGAQALERGAASPAERSSPRRSPSRSCASSPAARSCATPRSSRRCSRLICRELNNARIAQGRTEISADLLAGSRDTILTEFYERALADQPPGVRQFIEDELLTESGFRESLAEERVQKAFAAAGAPPMRSRRSSIAACCASRSGSTCAASS